MNEGVSCRISMTATMPVSVPHLLALAHGIDCAGPHACFYCMSPCGDDNPASVHVKSSFTGRNEVPAPGSPWVCDGCMIALREDAEIVQVDGTRRRVTRGCMRAFSWLITADRAVAASKAHLDRLRAICLDPPPAPWSLVLSDSGQKHLLYRGVVNRDDRAPHVVTLEAERVEYRPDELRRLLRAAGHYCAATGKPALVGPIAASGAMKVIERYPREGESIVDGWGRAWSTPIGRLAAWLCGPRDECQEEYPADGED